MQKTMIAIPCMDTVPTVFLERMLGLARPTSTLVVTARNSLVYDARNLLGETAIKHGYERILFIDSDMVFDMDLLIKLSADLDEGRRFVTALCFTRKNPILPCIYSETGYRKTGDITSDGQERWETFLNCMDNYPKDSIFPIKACGLAACMIETSVIQEVYARFGSPFSPVAGFGEDLSFCRRCDELGIEMWCDSRIKVGHIAQKVVTEADFLGGVVL